MKIRSVRQNNHKRAFEVTMWREQLLFPYAKADPTPTHEDPIVELFVDDELGREGFTFRLASGREGSVHVEQVLEYNQDPRYLRDLLLYRLTLEAESALEECPLSKREIIRRLGTSPAQFYRLLDPTNHRKSVDSMLSLLQVLDREVDLVVRAKSREARLRS
ncbi:MAG: helix-turn-helix domain-containing protein [Actinobacteria bacterium]|nr:helix-turn-helix domain-containing protein [Actinomycetota bacterium]